MAGTTRANPRAALLVLCVANFLVLLDTTAVNTAVPDIMRTLDAGIDDALWVLNAYLLAFAALLIIFGRLGDVLGPRTVFTGGLALFAAASVLCGLSASVDQLIWARVLQGVGAAALVPQALVLISSLYPAARRGAAFGVFTAVAGLAAVVGAPLGGLLVTAFGWQFVFYANVPVALLGLLAARRFVPDLRPGRPHRFDLLGVLLAAGGLTALVYGLVESVPMAFGVAAVLLVPFTYWQRHRLEPLLPPVLFRDRNFRITVVVVLVTNLALFGVLLVFTLHTQRVLDLSALASGTAALPLTLALAALAPFAGRLASRYGRPLIAGGLVLVSLGVVGLALLPTTSSTAWSYAGPLALVGLGLGLAVAPTTTEAMRHVAPQLTGSASGVLNTARQVGAVLGAAVVGAILQYRLTISLREQAMERVMLLPDAARQPYLQAVEQAAPTLHTPAPPPPGIPADDFTALVHTTVDEAFTAAARPSLLVVAALTLLAALLSTRLRRPTTPVATPVAAPATSAGRTEEGHAASTATGWAGIQFKNGQDGSGARHTCRDARPPLAGTTTAGHLASRRRRRFMIIRSVG